MGRYNGKYCLSPAGYGLIDASLSHPDGSIHVRVNDHWFGVQYVTF